MDAIGYLLLLALSRDDLRVGGMIDRTWDNEGSIGLSASYIQEPERGIQSLVHLTGRGSRVMGEIAGGVARFDDPLPGYDSSLNYGVISVKVGVTVQQWEIYLEGTHYSNGSLFRDGNTRNNSGYDTYLLGTRWRIP